MTLPTSSGSLQRFVQRTSLKTGFEYELENLDEYLKDFSAPRSVSVVTGYAAYDHIKSLCDKLCLRIDGLKINVFPIKNNFFGEQITVSGLLTGKDICEQLEGKELGDCLLFPDVCLRAEGDVFLDDMTPEELSDALNVEACPQSSDPAAFIRGILGI